MRKKIYISLPITGHNIKEVELRSMTAKNIVKAHGFDPVSPLDVSPNRQAGYAEHIGNDIAALLECDAALFLDGYKSSRGCRLEEWAARIYNMSRIYSFDELEGFANTCTHFNKK